MDEVFQDEDGMWYFYDETWADHFGPFSSEFTAHLNLIRYCEIVLG